MSNQAYEQTQMQRIEQKQNYKNVLNTQIAQHDFLKNVALMEKQSAAENAQKRLEKMRELEMEMKTQKLVQQAEYRSILNEQKQT